MAHAHVTSLHGLGGYERSVAVWHPSYKLRDALLTGQIAGAVMLAAMTLFAIGSGQSAFYPLQVIGSFVFGQSAFAGVHIPAIVTGAAIHQLGVTVVWSLSV